MAKKLGEASITSMVDGYLGNKKKKAKNSNLVRRHEAFWDTIVESLMLEVGEKESPPVQKIGPSSDDTRKRYLDFIQRVVATKLKDIKGNNPELWSKFRSMDEKGQAEFKRDIWNKYKEKEGANLKDKIQKMGTGDGEERSKSKVSTKKQDAGARINQQKRLEVVGNITKKILQHMVDLTKEGKPVPENLSSLSTRMLGFKPTNNIGKAKLQSLASKDGPISQEELNGFVKRAIENKTEGNIIDFANTKLGFYPGEYQDEVEKIADERGLPGNRDRERGIGTGVKTVDVGGKDIPYQRKGTSETPVYRMFKDFDVDDILKYYDYYQKNPDEINRSRKAALNIEPFETVQGSTGDSEKSFMMGNIKEPSLISKIGSSSTSSILSKRESEEAKKAREERVAKSGRGADFKQSFDLEPKDVLNRLSDFDEVPEPESIKDRLASGLADIKSVGAKKVSPRTISHLIRKMSLRTSDGKFVKLKDPEKVEWKSEEEKELAKKIFSKLDPKRLSGSSKESDAKYNIKNYLSDFISSEEEKVAANIPELEKEKEVKKLHKSERDKIRANKEKERMSLNPEDLERSEIEDQQRKEKINQAMIKRREELEKEKLKLSDKLRDFQDAERSTEPVTIGTPTGIKKISPLKAKKDLMKQLGGGSAVRDLKKKKSQLDALPSMDKLYLSRPTRTRGDIAAESLNVFEVFFSDEENSKEKGWEKAKPKKKMKLVPKETKSK